MYTWMLPFKWNWPCLIWSDKTLNIKEKSKIGQNQESVGHIFGFLKFVNLVMYMEKMGIFFFIKVVDPCLSFPNKPTTHKTEFYSFGYTQTTKQCL